MLLQSVAITEISQLHAIPDIGPEPKRLLLLTFGSHSAKHFPNWTRQEIKHLHYSEKIGMQNRRTLVPTLCLVCH